MSRDTSGPAFSKAIADTIAGMIEAGDAAFHKPTGETWLILGVNRKRDEVCAAGWPATIAKLSDCTLVKKGDALTPEELAHRQKAFGEGWE